VAREFLHERIVVRRITDITLTFLFFSHVLTQPALFGKRSLWSKTNKQIFAKGYGWRCPNKSLGGSAESLRGGNEVSSVGLSPEGEEEQKVSIPSRCGSPEDVVGGGKRFACWLRQSERREAVSDALVVPPSDFMHSVKRPINPTSNATDYGSCA
jgi:hypothetical protein